LWIETGRKNFDFLTNFGIYKECRAFGCLTSPQDGGATGPAQTKKKICVEMGIADTFKNPVPT
jgi:hypothetical protein